MPQKTLTLIWAEHPVRDLNYGQHLFARPLVGRFTLDFDVLHPAGSNLRLIGYQAPPGITAADALQLLDQISQ